MKIYVTIMETLIKKGRRGWRQDEIINHKPPPTPPPPLVLMYFFVGFFGNIPLFMTKLRVLILYFPYFTNNSLAKCFPKLVNIEIMWQHTNFKTKHVLRSEFCSQNLGDSFHKEKKKFVATCSHFILFCH